MGAQPSRSEEEERRVPPGIGKRLPFPAAVRNRNPFIPHVSKFSKYDADTTPIPDLPTISSAYIPNMQEPFLKLQEQTARELLNTHPSLVYPRSKRLQLMALKPDPRRKNVLEEFGITKENQKKGAVPPNKEKIIKVLDESAVKDLTPRMQARILDEMRKIEEITDPHTRRERMISLATMLSAAATPEQVVTRLPGVSGYNRVNSMRGVDKNKSLKAEKMLFTQFSQPEPEIRTLLREGLKKYEAELNSVDFYRDLIDKLFNMLPEQYGKDLFAKNVDVSNGIAILSPWGYVNQASTPTTDADIQRHSEIVVLPREVLNVEQMTTEGVGGSGDLQIAIAHIFNWITEHSLFQPRNRFYVHNMTQEMLTPKILQNNDIIISLLNINAGCGSRIRGLVSDHATSLVWVKNSFATRLTPYPIPIDEGGKTIEFNPNSWWCIVYDSSNYINGNKIQPLFEENPYDPNPMIKNSISGDPYLRENAVANYRLFKDQIINAFIERESYAHLQVRYSVCTFYALYVAWYFITSPPDKPINIDINVNPDRIAHLFAPFVYKLLRYYTNIVPSVLSYPNDYIGNGIFHSKIC